MGQHLTLALHVTSLKLYIYVAAYEYASVLLLSCWLYSLRLFVVGGENIATSISWSYIDSLPEAICAAMATCNFMSNYTFIACRVHVA